MGEWLRLVFGGRPALDERADGLLLLHGRRLRAVGLLLEAGRAGRGGLVRHRCCAAPLAKLTEPLHWAIYAAGAYGFLRMRPWMHPWAAVYTAQIAIGMLIWPLLYVGGVRGASSSRAVGFAAFACADARALARGAAVQRAAALAARALRRVGARDRRVGRHRRRLRARARQPRHLLRADRAARRAAGGAGRAISRPAYGVKTRVVAEDLSQPRRRAPSGRGGRGPADRDPRQQRRARRRRAASTSSRSSASSSRCCSTASRPPC